MKSMALPAALLALALPLGCATTQLSKQAEAQIAQRYDGQSRELTLSLWGTTFFGDSTRRLLSVQPPDEVDLLDDTNGKPIVPGLAQEVLPAGTKVKITHISFPGSWSNFTRSVMSPRDRTWVELQVDGKPASPSYVLVIRPDVKNEAEVAAEIDKLLTDKPLDAEVKALPAADQKVIATKELSTGASARALELAFGTPIFKRITGDGQSRLEDWSWRSDNITRTAHLKDGVVVSVEGPAVNHDRTVAATH